MKKRTYLKTFALTLIIVTLMITSLGVIIPKVFATGRIYIVPPDIDDPGLGPGSTFIVNATAENVEDVYTWQVQVEFDPTILHCIGAWVPTESIFNLDIKPPPIINNDFGFAVLGASLVMPPGVNGSDTLACFEFEVVGIGFTEIAYSKPYGDDTFLLDSELHEIPVTVEDGSFNNWVPPPPADLYIDPSRIVDPSFIEGSVFNVSLSIRNATNLNSWSAKIAYNKTILNATAVYEGDFLKAVGSTSFNFEIQHDYNTTHGLVDMSCIVTTGEGANGDGELAIITFEVVGLGQSDIEISEPDLRDPSETELPFNVYHGYFNNILMAKLRIEPSEVSGPEYVPGSTFTINVTLEDVENLKTCVFNLTYVPSVILEIDVNVPTVLGQTPIKRLRIDDVEGYIWAELTYPDQITTYEPVTIMMVEFQVVALGISPINLTDTELYDTEGGPITHEVYHGIFIGLIRDVAVIAVIPELNIAYQGWIVNVNVTVRNEGNLTETFDVEIYYDDNLGGTGTVTDLPPNEETTIIIAWDTSSVTPCHNYTISATALPVPNEFDLGDNTLADGEVKIRIMGDLDDNGVVDMKDINIVVDAYGAYAGSPKWNFYADLNRDGRIDLRDIGICANNFQKTCPS